MRQADPAAASSAGNLGAAPRLRHGYVDMRYGQLHYSVAGPAHPTGVAAPMVLFHQSPNSSVEFDALVTELGRDRVAIAIDTPGHGGSDGPEAVPAIEDYAAAIVEGLENLGYGSGRPVDVFGFHTGSRIATEIAVSHPGMVCHVILGLSPYALIGDSLSRKLQKEVRHPGSGRQMLEYFCEELPARVARALQSDFPDPAWSRIAVDSMRAGVRQEFGHAAAYEYNPRFRARLLELAQPVMLLVIDDPVDRYESARTAGEVSRELMPMLRRARSVVLLDDHFRSNAFYARAADLAAGFRRFVDAPG